MQLQNVELLPALEAGIKKATDEESLKVPRGILREILFSEAGVPAAGSTTDAIDALARTGLGSQALFVILRCLAVSGLIPPGNGSMGYQRSICELADNTNPQFTKFFDVESKTQTFEKFAKLEAAHSRICVILSPLARHYIGIETIVSAKGDILAALNHSIVRMYGEPFRLSEIRASLETVISKLGKVAAESSSLTSDIDECISAISNARRVGSENGSFLFHDFAAPLLSAAEVALGDFVKATQGRFTADIVLASESVDPLQKKYPLHEEGRDIEIRIPLRNAGPGIALDVSITPVSDTDAVAVSAQPVQLGDVLPGDFSVSISALIVEPTADFKGSVLAEWGEMGRAERKSDLFDFCATAQRADVDWPSLEIWHPYSTDPAEGDAFVGREDLVKNLSSKILRSPMESFYITGQKRVGKTSLARACAEHAKLKDSNIEIVEILWGSIANEDPRASLKSLGEHIEEFLTLNLPQSISYQKGNFDGTLSPLIKLSNLLKELRPDKKFVVIIDEFDEIHQELYLFGNLAETFFANIRAISGCRNMAMVLVGGENMPFVMERQGQKLNRFSGINLSYFSRSEDWPDYQKLVRQPSEPHLTWNDDGVAEVFNITNGNPYFTNIVCAATAREAYKSRDADITSREVSEAADLRLSSLEANAFVHLWQDGIFKPAEEREPEILRRSRVLVAMARALRNGATLTLEVIANNKGQSLLSNSEIEPVLNDFVRRDVLTESYGIYDFQLPLFKNWLVDVGYAKLVSDSLSEELSASVRADEEAARVRSDEVVVLSQSWPPFRGQHISADDIRAWFEQVPGHRDQRLLFEVLRATRVMSEPDIRFRLRSAYATLKQDLPPYVMQKLHDRRKDVVLTYLDGEGKSGQFYTGLFAEENKISVDCIVPKESFKTGFAKHVDKYGLPRAVVAIDDIAGTGGTFAGKIEQFCADNGSELRSTGLKFLIATLVGTREADRRIRKALGELQGIDADFRMGEILGPDAYAFDPQNSHWKNDEQRQRAKALCEDIGSHIEKRTPLGFDNQGLALVFPNNTPNNSLPVLRNSSKSSHRAWKPIFPRFSN